MALSVLGGVLGVASHFSLNQMRLYRAASASAGRQANLAQVGAIVGSLVSALTPADGDVVIAQDTALEVLYPIGAAIVCGAAPGAVVLPTNGAAHGNTFAAYTALPTIGDRLNALIDDSIGVHSMQLHITSASNGPAACAPLHSGTTWMVTTAETTQLSAATTVRVVRPFRLSFYRSSDAKWYLGGKDWNGAASQFNGIQPVLGPFNSYSTDARKTGLSFSYLDSLGTTLEVPVDVRRIRGMRITARLGSDSSVTHVSAADR